jgi:2-keto-4-pentenoate hydratase/2-oxohepta-3-ene-1,7-dioic acid hydratase in catechol pathway
VRLIAFKNSAEHTRLGARSGDEVVDLTAAGLPATLDELLRQGDPGMAAAHAALAAKAHCLPLASIIYLPPVQNLPKHPVIFQRFVSSWVAHKAPIVRPQVSHQFDYEAELVAVIGKGGRYIPKYKALEHVAGYSVFNDGSIRDYQMRTGQWLWGKNFDHTGGFGPEFVTANELPAGAVGLNIQCRLNGAVLQNANTRDMIFDVATLVAACSEGMALQPGDIIITGTPSGVGVARKPQVWMRPGDVCEIEVEGVGVLRNPVIDEAL